MYDLEKNICFNCNHAYWIPSENDSSVLDGPFCDISHSEDKVDNKCNWYEGVYYYV